MVNSLAPHVAFPGAVMPIGVVASGTKEANEVGVHGSTVLCRSKFRLLPDEFAVVAVELLAGVSCSFHPNDMQQELVDLPGVALVG